MKRLLAIITILICLGGCTARQAASIAAASIVGGIVGADMGDWAGKAASDMVTNATYEGD